MKATCLLFLLSFSNAVKVNHILDTMPEEEEYRAAQPANNLSEDGSKMFVSGSNGGNEYIEVW